MPLYDAKCPRCGNVQEFVAPSSAIAANAPVCCDGRMEHVWLPTTRLFVVSDIPEYQAMGTDIATGKAPVITSRSQHREYLKRNGYVEVGNEMPQRREVTISDREIGHQIKQVIDQKGIRL